jgi:hypothetical protein
MTAPEFSAVAMMRLNMIADCGRLNDANLRAILAQRMFAQLVPTYPLPARRRVKIIPSRRLAAHTHGLASCNR